MTDLTTTNDLGVVLIVFWIALEGAIEWFFLLIVQFGLARKFFFGFEGNYKPNLFQVDQDKKRFWSITIGIIVGLIVVYAGDASFEVTNLTWLDNILTILIIAGGKDAINEIITLPIRTRVKLWRQYLGFDETSSTPLQDNATDNTKPQ